jgi:hypothetical protein
MEETNLSITNSSNTNSKLKKSPDDRSSGLLLNIDKDRFLLFGGGNREKTFNDFWILKIDNNNGTYEQTWHEIKANLNINSRFGMVGLNINNNIWIHGGQNYFESRYYADLILLNSQKQVENNNITLSFVKNFTNFPLDIKNIPKERNSHAIAPVKINENLFIYLFGGGCNEGLLNDLWQFDTADNKWTKCNLKGEEISAREMHGMINYVNKNKESFLYIFGGRLYESVDNNIFRINISKGFTCEKVVTLPISICSFSYIGYKNYIIIYGGTDGITFLNDIIIFNITNHKLAKSKFLINTELVNNDANLTPFLGRIGSMMSIDESTGNLVIFGGSSLHKDTNYTFIVSLKDLLDENNIIPFI